MQQQTFSHTVSLFCVKERYNTWRKTFKLDLLPSCAQIRRRIHHHSSSGGHQTGRRVLSHRRLHEDVVSRHRAEGETPEHPAVPAAIARLLPGPRLWRSGQQLRGARRRGLLRLADHPGSGEDEDAAEMKAFVTLKTEILSLKVGERCCSEWWATCSP